MKTQFNWIASYYKPEIWIFDNDGTLYLNPETIESLVEKKMIEYIADVYSKDFENAKIKRLNLLKKHKTNSTLIAIKKEGLNEADFIDKTYLSISPEKLILDGNFDIIDNLKKMTGEKYVLTNNPSGFAKMILEALGIRDLFENIIGIQEINYFQKPEKESFSSFVPEINNGKRIIFFDDAIENIEIATQLGFIGVHVQMNRGQCQFHTRIF